MKQKFLSLVALMLFSLSIIAQTGTVKTYESRCKQSGSLKITMSPSGPYTYKITAGPSGFILPPEQASDSFSALRSGNYTIQVKSGATVVTTVSGTVAGNYVDPGLQTTTLQHIQCPSGTGGITAIMPTGGRQPYTYAITAGPVTRPVQSSTVFTGLPAGTYTLQSYDSCGIVRTASNQTVTYDTGRFVFTSLGPISHGCNALRMTFNGNWIGTSGDKPVMKWYITPGGDTIKHSNTFKAFSNNERDTLWSSAGKNYADSFGTWKILVYDTCGRLFSTTGTYTKTIVPYFVPTEISCNTYKLLASTP